MEQRPESRRRPRILITGLGWSGSSAIVDLLSGCSTIRRIPGEFDLFRRFGMIGDHVLGRIEPNFPSRACPPKTSTAKSQSRLSLPRRQLRRGINWVRRSNARAPLNDEGADAVERMTCHFAQKIDRKSLLAERVEVAVEWLDEVIALHFQESSNDLVLFDQPIVPHHHDGIWQKVFAPMHHIVVLRDPLDQLFEHYQWLVWPDKPVKLGTQDLLDAIGERGQAGVLSGMADRLLSKLRWVESLTNTPTPPLVLEFSEVVANPELALSSIEEFVGQYLGPNNWMNFDSSVSQANIGVGAGIEGLLDSAVLRTMRTVIETAAATSRNHESPSP